MVYNGLHEFRAVHKAWYHSNIKIGQTYRGRRIRNIDSDTIVADWRSLSNSQQQRYRASARESENNRLARNGEPPPSPLASAGSSPTPEPTTKSRHSPKPSPALAPHLHVAINSPSEIAAVHSPEPASSVLPGLGLAPRPSQPILQSISAAGRISPIVPPTSNYAPTSLTPSTTPAPETTSAPGQNASSLSPFEGSAGSKRIYSESSSGNGSEPEPKRQRTDPTPGHLSPSPSIGEVSAGRKRCRSDFGADSESRPELKRSRTDSGYDSDLFGPLEDALAQQTQTQELDLDSLAKSEVDADDTSAPSNTANGAQPGLLGTALNRPNPLSAEDGLEADDERLTHREWSEDDGFEADDERSPTYASHQIRGLPSGSSESSSDDDISTPSSSSSSSSSSSDDSRSGDAPSALEVESLDHEEGGFDYCNFGSFPPEIPQVLDDRNVHIAGYGPEQAKWEDLAFSHGQTRVAGWINECDTAGYDSMRDTWDDWGASNGSMISRNPFGDHSNQQVTPRQAPTDPVARITEYEAHEEADSEDDEECDREVATLEYLYERMESAAAYLASLAQAQATSRSIDTGDELIDREYVASPGTNTDYEGPNTETLECLYERMDSAAAYLDRLAERQATSISEARVDRDHMGDNPTFLNYDEPEDGEELEDPALEYTYQRMDSAAAYLANRAERHTTSLGSGSRDENVDCDYMENDPTFLNDGEPADEVIHDLDLDYWYEPMDSATEQDLMTNHELVDSEYSDDSFP